MDKAFEALSHELRTPLSVLQSAAEILEEQNEHLPHIHQNILSSMKEEIKRMIQISEKRFIGLLSCLPLLWVPLQEILRQKALTWALQYLSSYLQP